MKPHKMSLVIHTTRGTDSFEFLTSTKVEEVIHEVRQRFELTGDGQFALVMKESGEPAQARRCNARELRTSRTRTNSYSPVGVSTSDGAH